MDLNSFGSYQSIIYCQTHLKSVSVATPSSSYFLSPLKQTSDYVSSAPQDDNANANVEKEKNKLDLEEMRRRRDEEIKAKEEQLQNPEIQNSSNKSDENIKKRTPKKFHLDKKK